MKILSPVTRPESSHTRQRYYALAALLILLLTALHIYRFVDHDYREDEINTIYLAQNLTVSETVQWLGYNGAHPPGWRVMAVMWVNLFGMHEPIVRLMSTLFTMLALAMVFRFATDVFDAQTGFIAVLILGLLPFFQYYSQEFRPYAVLAFSAVLTQFALWRWLKQPRFGYALLFVAGGILMLYTHVFSMHMITSLALAVLILTRWDRGLYLRVFGLFAAIGLGFAPWLLAVVHRLLVVSPGGMAYGTSSLDGYVKVVQDTQGVPLLLLSALIIPVSLVFPYKSLSTTESRRFRFGAEWSRLYLALVPLITLVIVLLTNIRIRNLTPRNLMLILPVVVILVAFQLRAVRPAVRWAAVLLIACTGVFVFHKYEITVPYRDIVATIRPFTPTDRVVTNINHHTVGTSAITYYLLDQLPNAISMNEMFHFVEPGISATFLVEPDPVINIVQDYSEGTQAAFAQFLAGAERVWFVQYYGPPLQTEEGVLTPAFREALLEEFTLCGRVALPMTVPPDGSYAVSEFRRAPASCE